MTRNWINPIIVNTCELKIERVILTSETTDPKCAIHNMPNMVPPRDGKYGMTVVLDLDETLVHLMSDNLLFIRPFAKEFLRHLRELKTVELILWSAGDVSHVERCLASIDPKRDIFQHVICRGPWVKIIGTPLKNLSKLKRTHCIIVDDNPLAARKNGKTSIIIPEFRPTDSKGPPDTTLVFVLQIIGRLALYGSAGKPPLSVDEPPPDARVASKDWSISQYLYCHPYLVRGSKRSLLGPTDCLSLDVSDQETVMSRILAFHQTKPEFSDDASSTTSLSSVSSPIAGSPLAEIEYADDWDLNLSMLSAESSSNLLEYPCTNSVSGFSAQLMPLPIIQLSPLRPIPRIVPNLGPVPPLRPIPMRVLNLDRNLLST